MEIITGGFGLGGGGRLEWPLGGAVRSEKLQRRFTVEDGECGLYQCQGVVLLWR